MSNIFDNPTPEVPFDQQEGQNLETQATEEPNVNVSEETSPENSGQEVENVEVPDWQKEFASPEEMYAAYANTKKSYDHIRPKLTTVTQELAQLKKGNVDTIPQSQQPVQPTQQVAQHQQSAEDIVRDFISESTRPVVEQMEQIMLQQEISNVANKYKDFADYGEGIKQLLEANPALWNVPNAVENAYKLAKFDSIGADLDKAVEKATQKAYADKQIKVLGSDNKARPSQHNMEPKAKSAEEQIADSILSAGQSKKTIFF